MVRYVSWFMLLLVLIPSQTAIAVAPTSQDCSRGEEDGRSLASADLCSKGVPSITVSTVLGRYARSCEFQKKQAGTSGSGRVESSKNAPRWIPEILLGAGIGVLTGLLDGGDKMGMYVAMGVGLGVLAVLVESGD